MRRLNQAYWFAEKPYPQKIYLKACFKRCRLLAYEVLETFESKTTCGKFRDECMTVTDSFWSQVTLRG